MTDQKYVRSDSKGNLVQRKIGFFLAANSREFSRIILATDKHG